MKIKKVAKSRKFWAAVAGVGLALAHGNVPLACGIIAAYIGATAYEDAGRAKKSEEE